MKHNKKSLVEAQVNHQKGAWGEVTENVADTLVTLVAITTTAVLFIAILGVALGLGAILHWAQDTFTWMPAWMLMVGHAVEAVLFVADIAGLIWSVVRHYLKQLGMV